MAYIGQNADGNFTTSVSKDTFSGNDSTTAFTLSEAATTNTVDVFVENIRQEPTTAYTVDGTTLTFTAAPVTGTNNIYVVNRGPIQLSASHPAAQSLSAFSATITNDLTVDTNTLFVDASENKVGIGTTTTTDAGVTITPSVTRVNSWDAKLALQSTEANDFPALLFSGAAATTRYGGIVSTTDITGNTPANETAEINFLLSSSTAGNIVFRTNDNIGTTSTSERMRILSGGGITFNGDTATANALDDYEKGSWTPDIRRNDGTVSATFTVGTGTATYVKIGRVVHLKCWLHTISNGSSDGSSYWRVNGLPFTGKQYSGSASGYNSLTPNSLYIGDAGGNIILTSDTTPYTGSLLGTIMINITYETDS